MSGMSLCLRQSLGISMVSAPPHLKDSAEVVHLVRMPPGRLPLEVFQAHSRQNSLEGLYTPIWPGNASGSPRRSWRVLLGKGKRPKR